RENDEKRARTVKVDIDLAKAFIGALNDLKRAVELAGTPDLAMLAALPDLVKIEDQKEDLDAAWESIAVGVRQAIDRLAAMRETEGARLASDLELPVRRLGQRIEDVDRRAPEAVKEHAARPARRTEEPLGTARGDAAR